MNLKRINDAVKATYNNVSKYPIDYDYTDFPEGPFGKSKILQWVSEDSSLYLTDPNGTDFGSIWKVKGKNKFAFFKETTNFLMINGDMTYYRKMAKYAKCSVKEAIVDIEDCIANYNQYFNEKVAEVESSFNK